MNDKTRKVCSDGVLLLDVGLQSCSSDQQGGINFFLFSFFGASGVKVEGKW